MNSPNYRFQSDSKPMQKQPKNNSSKSNLTATISRCSLSAVKTERGVIISDARILRDLGDGC